MSPVSVKCPPPHPFFEAVTHCSGLSHLHESPVRTLTRPETIDTVNLLVATRAWLVVLSSSRSPPPPDPCDIQTCINV